jgi:MFS family permease
MTASTTLISLYFAGLQRDRWLAVQVASTNVMGVIVVLAGGFAGEHGWRAPFFAYAIAIVLLLPVLLVTYEPRRAPKAEGGPLDAPPDRSWIRLVAIRCALTFFVSVTVYTLIVQLGFLFVERGVTDPSTIGLGISFGAGGVALGSIANTAMLSISPRFRLSTSYLLIACGLGIIALNAGFAIMCLGSLAAGLGAGCTVSTLLCITVADAPAGQKGRATGAWTAAMFLGQFLNPPIFLVLVYFSGSHAGAFAIYAGICAAIATGAGVHTVVARRPIESGSLGQAR